MENFESEKEKINYTPKTEYWLLKFGRILKEGRKTPKHFKARERKKNYLPKVIFSADLVDIIDSEG